MEVNKKLYMQTRIKDFIAFFEKDYPLIKLFEYGENDYLLYDAKANFAFIIPNHELDILLAFLEGKTIEEIASNRSLDTQSIQLLTQKYSELKEKGGLFIPGPLKQISPTNKDKLQKLIDYYDKNILIRKFVLEVTEDCNYRCTYCPNTLATEFRKHSKSKMSFETAKNAINYYFSKYVELFGKLSEEKKSLLLETVPPTLSWYGGEPMMNFELLKQSTEYFISLGWEDYSIPNDCLRFVSNTNLSIMNKQILEFLTKYDVKLYASLDGPKEENNKCRLFENGGGTFDVAYSNLLKIKEYNPEYFKNSVIVIAVEDDVHDHRKCHDFLNSLGIPISYSIRGYTDCIFKNAKEQYHDIVENFDTRLTEAYDKVMNAKNIAEHSGFFDGLIPFLNINYDSPNGQNRQNMILSCPMGVDNSMIGVKGDFHICHKTDGSMPFSNINEKVDLTKLAELYKIYNTAINNNVLCHSCWMVAHCSICAAERIKGNKIISPSKDECKIIKKRFEYLFSVFLFTYIHRPDLLEELQKKKDNRREYISIVDINTF